MEDHLAQRLLSDPEFVEDIGDRYYAASALGLPGIPARPQSPWVVWNELPSTDYLAVRETSGAQLRTFQFYVYDEKGDFARINRILGNIKRVVKAMAPFTTEDGTRCSDSVWAGFSGNLPADEYDANVRIGTARFTVSR